MEAVGPIWDKDHVEGEMDEQFLVDEFQFAKAFHYRVGENYNDIPIPYSGHYWGLKHVLSGAYNAFAYGLYKITFGSLQNNNSYISFYLDYTDCDYTDYYEENDMWIRYNSTNSSVLISWDDGNFDDNNNTSVIPGKTYRIWENKDKYERENQSNTSFLELFLTLGTENNHPKLEWNPYHDNTSLTSYKLFKSKSNSPFELLADLGSNTLSYVDTEEIMPDMPEANMEQVEYYVKAELEHSAYNSNTVSTNVEGDPLYKKGNKKNEVDNNLEYTLSANYPNPFNPTTIINYSIPEKTEVNIKVYDPFGREAAELVNGVKAAGNYQVIV
jgi:hypothetical protein